MKTPDPKAFSLSLGESVQLPLSPQLSDHTIAGFFPGEGEGGREDEKEEKDKEKNERRKTTMTAVRRHLNSPSVAGPQGIKASPHALVVEKDKKIANQ